jgi:putative FmdB family regulatory protein
MALYEYFCPTCKTRFEQRRPMAEATAAATCAQGHKAERALSVFAVSRTGGAIALDEAPMGGGGCCGGGGCACASAN